MATFSEIKITFTREILSDEYVTFGTNNQALDNPDTIYEKWVNIRSRNNEVTISPPNEEEGDEDDETVIIEGQGSAANYIQSFNLDYNYSGVYEISRDLNVVTIKSKLQGLTFEEDNSFPTPEEVLFEFNNDLSPVFEILDVSFDISTTNPCNYLLVKVLTSEIAPIIESPISINNNTNNPISFEWLRNQSIQIRVKNAAGIPANKTVVLPAQLSPLNFDIDIVYSPSGATATITDNTNYKPGSPSLDVEYSLNDIDWQNENTFSGLPVGDYTLYIKDVFGCKDSKNFKIDEFEIGDPYFYLSKSNSFRFAELVNRQNCSNYKTDENTLSCEVDTGVVYKEVQQFQTCDKITTQFKSNYNNISVYVIKEDNSEIEILTDQKTNNIGIKDLRDAFLCNLGNGLNGIYFNSGSIYNYDTGLKIKDYILNGALPEYGRSGIFIKIDTNWFKVVNVIFDDTRNVEMLVISNNYSGNDAPIKVGCLYNRFNYEVYEFPVDFSEYPDQYIRIRIDNNDSYYPGRVFLSELINVKDRHKNTVEIVYKNDTNNDIFYSTGITHKIRLPITSIGGKIDEDNNTHKMDTGTILLSSSMYEVDEFIFEPVTKEIMRKLTYALSHRLVKIDGVPYVKNGDFDLEGPLEESNLYVVTANMIKSENYFNDKSSSDDIIDIGDDLIEVPELIVTDIGYLKY